MILAEARRILKERALRSSGAEHHSPNAEQIEPAEVDYLLAHELQCSTAQPYLREQQTLSDQQWQHWQRQWARRLQGEPMAHILGERGFWTLDLYCDASTLIPRPDTEALVEAALRLLPQGPLLGLDAGTGTGALALALRAERPDWTLLAMDFSEPALRLAKRNAARHDLPLLLFRGDWLQAVANGSLDFIISNPPYIDPQDPHLQQGDLRFEPLSALVAEQQGLACYQLLLEQGRRVLRPHGYLLLEHGYDQAASLAAMAQAMGWTVLEQGQDYGGNDRFSLLQC